MDDNVRDERGNVSKKLSRGEGRAAQRLVRTVLQGALRLLPRGGHIAVYGWGDDEGNAIEVLRYLCEHYDGRVYWLVDSAPSPELLERLAPLAGPPPILVPRMTPRAVALFLTARAVFHTHGLFAGPHPGSRKVHVNLWHGDGPKRMSDVMAWDAGKSSFVVSGTRFWGRNKARRFGLPESRLLVTGNPRIDQLARPPSDEVMRQLGLDLARPLVLWMPTFRTATLNGQSLWSDSPLLLGDEQVRGVVDQFAELVEATGAQFVVKPHPLDAEAFDALGVTVLRSSDLAAAGCGLYSLLGRCAALVTDYSSVWTDFLAVDRPILLFCPDLDKYQAGRAFNVDRLEDVAPSPIAQSVDELLQFLRDVAGGRDVHAASRRQRGEQLGAVVETGAAARLFAALCSAGELCVHRSHSDRRVAAASA